MIRVIALVALLGGCGAVGWMFYSVLAEKASGTVNSAAVDSPLIGRAAPAFEAVLLDGSGLLTAADLRGDTPIVVNFFASWCAPCAVEHGQLTELATSGRAAVYGVAFQDKPQDAQRFLRRLGDPFTATALDPRGRAGLEWGVAKVPESFILSPDGIVLYKHAGVIRADDLTSGPFHAALQRAAGE